ncbi:hypothetical protein ACFVWF_27930 [Rhodococcus qingshengii]|uniref:hypothetical protein n=1 Tax=Rhodococcus qingshengii TaxID=334542 RepID=UPI0036D80DC3
MAEFESDLIRSRTRGAVAAAAAAGKMKGWQDERPAAQTHPGRARIPAANL